MIDQHVYEAAVEQLGELREGLMEDFCDTPAEIILAALNAAAKSFA